MDTRNKIGMFLLIVFILMVVIGGYFLMDYMINNNDEEKTSEIVEDIRIDETKDYVYFKNSEELIDEIYKEDVVLNFKGLESVNETLHTELEELSNDINIVSDDECSFKYREYTYTSFGNYISLVITDNEYDCSVGSTPSGVKSYVINKTDGTIYTEEELLNIFNISDDSIISQVKSRLNNTQVLDEEEEVIDISGTISSITSGTYNDIKALSISKNGKLMLNFIVISNKINYNDSIELESEE